MKKWSVLLVLLVIGVIFSSCANQFPETMMRGLEGTKTNETKEWDGDKSNYTYSEEDFESKAQSMGITVEELKEQMLEEFESKAESMGISVEELKELMKEGKTGEEKEWDGDKSNYTYSEEELESKAESMGITVEELIELMKEGKKEK